MEKKEEIRLKIDHKKLLNLASKLEKNVEGIFSSKTPDIIKVSMNIIYSWEQDKVGNENLIEIGYKKKRKLLDDTNDKEKRKNDNYNIVRSSYVKINND